MNDKFFAQVEGTVSEVESDSHVMTGDGRRLILSTRVRITLDGGLGELTLDHYTKPVTVGASVKDTTRFRITIEEL